MLAKRIIPCLDVDHGKVKKGINFKNLVDVGSPVEIAAEYELQGADELVFLDITATLDQRKTMAETVEEVSKQVFMPLTLAAASNPKRQCMSFCKAVPTKFRSTRPQSMILN